MRTLYRSKSARKVFIVKMGRGITAMLQKKENIVVYREKIKASFEV